MKSVRWLRSRVRNSRVAKLWGTPLDDHGIEKIADAFGGDPKAVQSTIRLHRFYFGSSFTPQMALMLFANRDRLMSGQIVPEITPSPTETTLMDIETSTLMDRSVVLQGHLMSGPSAARRGRTVISSISSKIGWTLWVGRTIPYYHPLELTNLVVAVLWDRIGRPVELLASDRQNNRRYISEQRRLSDVCGKSDLCIFCEYLGDCDKSPYKLKEGVCFGCGSQKVHSSGYCPVCERDRF